jgi:hypothetical protein
MEIIGIGIEKERVTVNIADSPRVCGQTLDTAIIGR